MKIILIRHAKVLLDSTQKLTASQMKRWVERYNHAAIDTIVPSKKVIQHIKNADMVLASTHSRTSDSLAVIEVVPTEINSLFNEVALPEVNGDWLKLSPKMWLLILRLMMLLGFGKKSKLYTDAKQRAKNASAYLIDLAKQHESIALMGHGGTHWLMAKELDRLGWKCVEKNGGNRNWSYKVYRLLEMP